jgi:uncharacterized membrane protein
MPKIKQHTIICQICKKPVTPNQVIPGEMVREPVAELIRKDHPDWSNNGVICLHDLNHYRTEYFKQSLESERGELSELDAEIIKSIHEQELLSKDTNGEFDRQLTFGERTADSVAEFGGSWRFIIIFGSIILIWLVINSIALLRQPFDPYPYILLNLVLSCLAAIQAPIIMMSQNRQEARDRLQSENDYKVNLKAELEIRHLNAKMDQLLNHQWQRLMEIQDIQMELMEEVMLKRQPV